jgi:hypothetical protein
MNAVVDDSKKNAARGRIHTIVYCKLRGRLDQERLTYRSTTSALNVCSTDGMVVVRAEIREADNT